MLFIARGNHGTCPRRLVLLVVLVLFGVSVSGGVGFAVADPQAAPTAQTSTGNLQGTSDGSVDRFLGIRYAKAPVGALRFAPTQPSETTSIALDASKPGRSCPQTAGASSAAEGEDCLFLNVVRPAGASDRALPVVVWWHGGGFLNGSGARYDPTRMVVEGDVVVVTVNYRLGDLGYLSLPGLPGGGNFGLGDQIESLRWVRKNIAAFGGDAGNVTVAGESAGALSVCAALASPAAAGLFDKAIMSSGACAVEWAAGIFGRSTVRQSPFRSRAAADQAGVNRASSFGCSGSTRLACLRGKPASTFLKATGLNVYPPVYGTPLLPKHPTQALRDGSVNKVPVLSGSNHDEGHYSIGQSQNAKAYTSSEYASILRANFGNNVNRVAQAYPSVRHPSPAMAWARAAGDASWSCPTLAANRLASSQGPLYSYEFNDVNVPTSARAPNFTFGAYHATDLFYLFDFGVALNPAQQELGRTMRAYWTTFARTGDPNGEGLPPMPRFDGAGVTTSLAPGDGGIKPTDFARDHQCDLWATVPF